MSTCTPDRKLPYTEVAAHLDRALDQADLQREAGLAQLARVRSAKQTMLQREQQRLAKKLGARHPRVQALERKREANTAMLREVNLDLARATTPPINPDDTVWLLHGRVLDRQRQGQPGLTITLVDAKGNWVRELGYACTDTRGYFRLSVDNLKSPPETPEAADATTVQLRVSDRANTVLHTDKLPLTPRLGQVDYREITLGEPPADCRGPEGGTGAGPQPPTTVPAQPSPELKPQRDTKSGPSNNARTAAKRPTKK